MKKWWACAGLILVFGALSSGTAALIASNGLEPGDSWIIVNGSNQISSANGATDATAGQRIRSGANSWQVSNISTTMQLASVSMSGYTQRQVSVRLSSPAHTSTQGTEASDVVRIFAALDGAAFSATPDIVVAGNVNAKWGFWATNQITTTAGTITSNQAPQGGTSTNNYANLFINLPDTATSIALRVTAINNDTNEFWCVDDIELRGVTGSATNTAPVLVNAGGQTATSGAALIFDVQANDLTDHDTITLSASNLPPGAIFNTATNVTSVTNTFTWNPVGAVGAYPVAFFAVDKDGVTAVTSIINVVGGAITNDPVIWLNELHYDNAGGDVGEAFEIAGPAGFDLTNHYVLLYNAAGAIYGSNALAGVISDEGCGFGARFYTNASISIQNGPNNGLAICQGTNVIQFLSYEGTLVAAAGAAAGYESRDMGASETGEVAGRSIQLIGTGTNYNQFIWGSTNLQSFGLLNSGQNISPCIGAAIPPIFQPLANRLVTNGQALAFNVIATDFGEGDVIELSVTNLPPGAVFDTVTNAAAVTNTFNWNPISPPGTYTTTFFAADNDGVSATTITIRVVDPPSVIITTAPQAVVFDVRNIEVAGTASTNVIGFMRWTNTLTSAGALFPAAANWSLGAVSLAIGDNVIIVRGSNSFNEVATATVTIVRSPPQISGCSSQIYFQGFETGDTWAITAGTNFISSSTGAADFPPDQRIASGAASWQVRAQATNLDLAQVTVAGFTGRYVRIRVSATATTVVQGLDGGDFVQVFASLDGGSFSPAIDLHGSNNALWGFWATNVITGAAGESVAPFSVAPQPGLSTNNYSTLYVVLPDSANSLALRVAVSSDNAAEGWNVDDIALLGCPSGPTPPVFLPALTNVVAVLGGSLSFQVSAVDAVEGDTIELSASNLPPGAIFNTATNAAAVTNSFLWNPAGPLGVYTTTFYAVDNDGVTSNSITITVIDLPPGIRITNGAASFPHSVSTITIGGTATVTTVGNLTWTNFPSGQVGTAPAATNWSISDIPLVDGFNSITVKGTNSSGQSAAALVFFSRQAALAQGGTNVLLFQGFEPGDNWTILGGAASISSSNGATDTPPNQRVRSGTNSWQVSNTNTTLDLAPMSIAGFAGCVVNLHVSSTSTNPLVGVDNGDRFRVFVAVNGTNYPDFPNLPEIDLIPSTNCLWAFDTTNTFVATFGKDFFTDTAPPGLSSNFQANLFINIPNNATSVAMRIFAVDSTQEFFNVDDISVQGAPIAIDSDGDGIDDVWEQLFFTNLTTASATSDFDGDGFIDQSEFYAGSDPNNTNSLLKETAVSAPVSGGFLVTWQSHTGRYYIVSRSTNLMAEFTGIATNIFATPPLNVYTDTVVTPIQHYRVEGKNGPF